MRLALLAPLAALALLAASPAPDAASQRTLTIVCQRTPFYVFQRDQNLPQRAPDASATLGQRFRLVSGPRTTLESVQYYQTDVSVTEPGYPAGAHYWVRSDCAQPSS